jgi:hypothetical protein
VAHFVWDASARLVGSRDELAQLLLYWNYRFAVLAVNPEKLSRAAGCECFDPSVAGVDLGQPAGQS